MSYSASISGKLAFDPPATYWDLKTWDQDIEPNLDGYRDLAFHRNKDVVETQEGLLTKESSRLITPDDGESNGYYTQATLEAMVALLPGRKWDGHILVSGEEQGDLWRMTVVDDKVNVEHAKLVWEDGSPVETYYESWK